MPQTNLDIGKRFSSVSKKITIIKAKLKAARHISAIWRTVCVQPNIPWSESHGQLFDLFFFGPDSNSPFRYLREGKIFL